MNETYDHIIYFVSFTESAENPNETGCGLKKTPVYADIPELNQFDYTEAQSDGLRAEKKFVTAESLEYNGERFIEYSNPARGKVEYYKIIRSNGNKGGRGLTFVCQSVVSPWENSVREENGSASSGFFINNEEGGGDYYSDF